MGRQSRDKRDAYYRKAKVLGVRARSAFKLLQIDDHFDIIDGVTRAVDLCAAPGGWSEVLSFRMNEESKAESKRAIVAVDLQAMKPIPGVHILKGDITRQRTAEAVIALFDGQKADLVLIDGAPDVIGLHDKDEYVQAQLVLSALGITTHLLRPGGTFVAKVFRGREIHRLYAKLLQFFARVSIAKPKACRNSSIEGFVVCQDFAPPKDFVPDMSAPMSLDGVDGEAAFDRVPFVACGVEPGALDSDKTYPLSSKLELSEQERKLSAHLGGHAGAPSTAAAVDAKQRELSVVELKASAAEPAVAAAGGASSAGSAGAAGSGKQQQQRQQQQRPAALLSPTAPPIAPPWLRAAEATNRQAQQGKRGKGSSGSSTVVGGNSGGKRPKVADDRTGVSARGSAEAVGAGAGAARTSTASVAAVAAGAAAAERHDAGGAAEESADGVAGMFAEDSED